MLKSVHSGFGILIILFCAASARAQEAWIEKVAARTSPAVVTVLAFDEKGERLGLGSGFIVRSDGLIVTNYHVIQGAAFVEVRSRAIGAYNVSGVVAFNREKDFAVLKINAANLPALRLGNSSDVKLGESVMVIGNPKGLTGTISAGLISQFRQEESFSLLQTSAPIYPGNSGGPLINKQGEVIGVVTARFGDSPTLGLALPVNYIAAELRKNTEISHSLATLARIEKVYAEKEAEEKLKSILRENFARYTDPDGLYSLIVPKDWRVQRDQSWNEGRTALSQTTVIAPEHATLAQLHGYVSEGIRISAVLPPEGRSWTEKTISKYEETVAQNLLKTNPGFAQTDSQMVSLSDQPVRLYQFVGQDRRLPEPEKTVMYVIARPQALMTIELIVPTSKLKLLDVLRLFSAASFTLNIPAPKPQVRAAADNAGPTTQPDLRASLPIRPGDSLRRVREIYQFSAPLQQDERSRYCHFPQYGVWFFFDLDDRVTTIRLDGEFAGAVGGVRLGDSRARMLSLKGSEYRTWKFGNENAYSFGQRESGNWVRYDVDPRTQQVVTIFL